MKLGFSCLPNGALPYSDVSGTTRMMVKLFENIPYLPFMPHIDKKDTVIYRTLDKIPALTIKEDEIILKNNSDKFIGFLSKLDKAYGSLSKEDVEKFASKSVFMEKYCAVLSRLKPAETVINLLGPFTLSQMLKTADDCLVLCDKNCRKFIVQLLVVKAIWFINKVHEYSPETKPIIMFEEPRLNEFGKLKRENENITKETLLSIYSKIFHDIHKHNGSVGVQCFNKCDWQISIDSGVNIISFGAYNNPNNLTIIPKKIRKFVSEGGYINWGIVPVHSESLIKTLNISNLENNFRNTVELLTAKGISIENLYKHSTVSVQGDLDKLPVIFAEKALILSNQLGQKITNC